jgi:hypothetical protein
MSYRFQEHQTIVNFNEIFTKKQKNFYKIQILIYNKNARKMKLKNPLFLFNKVHNLTPWMFFIK